MYTLDSTGRLLDENRKVGEVKTSLQVAGRRGEEGAGGVAQGIRRPYAIRAEDGTAGRLKRGRRMERGNRQAPRLKISRTPQVIKAYKALRVAETIGTIRDQGFSWTRMDRPQFDQAHHDRGHTGGISAKN